MNKSGIVLQTDKRTACLMTSDGQFIKVRIKGNNIPQNGEIYSGEIYNKLQPRKGSLIAAAISFFIFLSGGMYTYYTPAAELTISINPSVRITLNRWNRIIKSTPLNNDGEKILSSIKLSNKTLDDALNLIVDQAKVDNYIDDKYNESGKFISVHINEDKNKKIDLAKFEQDIKNQDIGIEIVDDTNKEVSDKNNSPTTTEKPDSKSEKVIEKTEMKEDSSNIEKGNSTDKNPNINKEKEEEKQQDKLNPQLKETGKDQINKDANNNSSEKKNEDSGNNSSSNKDDKINDNSKTNEKEIKNNKSNNLTKEKEEKSNGKK